MDQSQWNFLRLHCRGWWPATPRSCNDRYSPNIGPLPTGTQTRFQPSQDPTIIRANPTADQRDHWPLELRPGFLSVPAQGRPGPHSQRAGVLRVRRATMLAGGNLPVLGLGAGPGAPLRHFCRGANGSLPTATRRPIELPKNNPLLRGAQRRRGACLRDSHREWYPDESGRQVLGGTH